MKKILLVLALLVGCSGFYCKPVIKTPDQIVIKHGSASNWFNQAYQQAQTHCSQYGKRAKLDDTDCSMAGGKASLYANPGLNCVSVFLCEEK
jgi:hypothetical protein